MPNYNAYGYSYPQYNNYQPQMQQPQVQNMQQLQSQPQIQNGGLVSVHNEMEARNYPIAIGTSITFKDENAPYVYTKTMGFSQLESPKFDKYRLVKEDPSEPIQQAQIEPKEDETYKNTLNGLKAEIEEIRADLEGVKKKLSTKTTSTKKKEVSEDESE